MKFPSKIDRKVTKIIVDDNQQLGPLKQDLLVAIDQKLAQSFSSMQSGVNTNLQSLKSELQTSVESVTDQASLDASAKDKIVKDELQLQFAGEVSDIRSDIQSETDELREDLQSQMFETNQAIHTENERKNLELKNTIDQMMQGAITRMEAEIQNGVDASYSDASSKDRELQTILEGKISNFYQQAKDDASTKDAALKANIDAQIIAQTTALTNLVNTGSTNGSSSIDALKTELTNTLKADSTTKIDALKIDLSSDYNTKLSNLNSSLTSGLTSSISESLTSSITSTLSVDYNAQIAAAVTSVSNDYNSKINNSASSLSSDYNSKISQSSNNLTIDYTSKIASATSSITADYLAKDAIIVNDYTTKINNQATTLTTDYVAKIAALKTELNNSTDSKIATAINNSNANYVTLTGNQTVIGVKTFAAIPVLPSTTPTANNEAASKAYVDSVGNRAPTTSVRGGILRQPAMVDVVVAPTLLNWNNLLAALRAAGILAT